MNGRWLAGTPLARAVTGRTQVELRPEESNGDLIGAGAPVRSFPLLRYYVATSLVVILIITVTAAFLFVQSAERDFTQRSTTRSSKEASHFVQLFYGDIWLPAQQTAPGLGLEGVVRSAPLDDFARRIAFGLDTVMLNVLDLNGRVAVEQPRWPHHDTESAGR